MIKAREGTVRKFLLNVKRLEDFRQSWSRPMCLSEYEE